MATSLASSGDEVEPPTDEEEEPSGDDLLLLILLLLISSSVEPAAAATAAEDDDCGGDEDINLSSAKPASSVVAASVVIIVRVLLILLLSLLLLLSSLLALCLIVSKLEGCVLVAYSASTNTISEFGTGKRKILLPASCFRIQEAVCTIHLSVTRAVLLNKVELHAKRTVFSLLFKNFLIIKIYSTTFCELRAKN